MSAGANAVHKPLLYIQSTFVGALCAWTTQAAFAGEAEWTKYSTEGAKAYEQANWGSAERLFKLALKEADAHLVIKICD